MTVPPRRRAFSLAELLTVVVLLGIVATLILHRVNQSRSSVQQRTCTVNVGDIEIQVQRWRRLKGSLPTSDLSDIAADGNYFPSGLPSCPAGGGAYTIDSRGRVVGHGH